MLPKLTRQTNEQNDEIVTFTGPDSTRSLVLRASMMNLDSELYKAVSKFGNEIEQAGLEFIRISQNRDAVGKKLDILKVSTSHIAPAIKSMTKVLAANKLNRAERRAKKLDTSRVDQATQREYREYLRSLSSSKVFGILMTSKNVDLVASAVAAPDLIGLDPSLFPRLEDRYAVIKAVYQPQAPYAPKPAAITDLAPIDPDFEALEKRAAQEWEGIADAQSDIEIVEQYLQATFGFFASMAAGTTGKEIFEIVQAA